MADDAPIVQNSGVPTILSDGLGSEARKELDNSFDRFFQEEDAKPKQEEPIPSAPAIKLASKPEVDEPPAKPEAKAPESTEHVTRPSSRPPEVEVADPVAEPVQDEPDPEIDSLDLDKGASSAHRSQFKELKSITKRFKQEADTLKGKLSPLMKELGIDDPAAVDALVEKVKTLKAAPVSSPEQDQELELYRNLSRRSGLEKSVSYQRGYVAPLKQGWNQFVDLLSAGMEPSNELAAWANDLKTRDGARLLNSDWLGEHMNLLTRYDGLTKQRVVNLATELKGKQQEADQVLQEISGSGDLYAKWQQVEGEQYGQELDRDYRAAAERAFQTTHKNLAAWKPRDESKITDPTELAAIVKENNAKFPDREKKFGSLIMHAMNDRNAFAADVLDFISMQERMPVLETENAALKKEIAQLKRDKGIRQRIQGHELQPNRGTGGKSAPEKAKLSESKRPDFSSL